MRISDWSSDVCSSDLIKVNLDSREVLLRPTGTDRTIAEWRELERDLALAEPGFAVKIIPASGTRLAVRFENGSTEADPAALSLLQWMMTRMDHPPVDQIGRVHVLTPVTNTHIVCRLLFEKKKDIH